VTEEATFHEAGLGPYATPIRDLGLKIEGTVLEPLLAELESELAVLGLTRVKPRFYLSTEWGVPFGTVALAIPFYLARPDLEELHADRTGLVEGADREDILRYLRHEMGHVISYAYLLYERPEWISTFGAITQPYVDDYHPQPWSPRYVRHLPGWYAQKHPDEDWAETFAVWMTPGNDWRTEYAPWPDALAKLELCDALMREVSELEPSVTDDELDEDLSEIEYSIDEYYADLEEERAAYPAGLDGGLRTIFTTARPGQQPAAALIRRTSRTLSRAVFTWTGHFPERTRALLHHLEARAHELSLGYDEAHEQVVVVALSAFVTSLAMNHVLRGAYLP
jgi:hypothetical protein